MFKKDLWVLHKWFKSLMTSSTTPEELHSRKNCGFFLSDSQASLLLQLLPKNCVQERFLGSSWVIQELHYFFNYSKRRIVFKNPATSLRGHHQLLLVTWRRHTQAQFTTNKIPFYKELSQNQSVRLIIEPKKKTSTATDHSNHTLQRESKTAYPCVARLQTRPEKKEPTSAVAVILLLASSFQISLAAASIKGDAGTYFLVWFPSLTAH